MKEIQLLCGTSIFQTPNNPVRLVSTILKSVNINISIITKVLLDSAGLKYTNTHKSPRTL